MPTRKKSVISKASPHTIKKFELIEEYIKSWAQKLMLQESCNGLIYIDCMCNSGIYTDDSGKTVEGSPVRVANVLLDVARTYMDKVLRGKLRAAETAAYFRRYSLPDCACGHQTAHNHYDERRASVTC